MSRKFLTAIDLSKNELQNAAVHNLPSAPAAPVKGQLYFNTTGGDNTLYWWDGTTWQSAKGGAASFPGYGPVVAEQTFGGTPADGVALTVARSDHKHANPLHDAAAHAAIPINSLGTATGPINMGGFTIQGVGTPVNPTDAANKSYVDNAVAGLSWKDSVRAGTTANITLSAPQTIDGVAVIAGDRVLVKNQTTPAQNGIYVVAAGAWTRSTDADLNTELLGAAVYVEEGTTQADTAWVMTANAPITVGTTALPWAQFAGGGAVTAGNGLTQTGNTLNVVGDTSIVVTADLVTRGALTGDVTAAQSSNATTIANNAVTNVKAADMPANTMKGNNTGATADPIDLTVPQIKTLLAYIGYSEADGLYSRVEATNTTAGTTTTFAHGLGTRDITVQVYRNSTPWDVVEADITHPAIGTTAVTFAVAVAAGEYRIVVTGKL